MRIFCYLSLLIFLGLNTPSAAASSREKGLTIIVDSSGLAFMGRDTLSTDQLAGELEKRLWKGYMGTGEMYPSIHLQFRGEVLMGVRGATMDAIQLAQKNVSNEVSLHLHKKLFKDLSTKQQKKIRKQFPVLFQRTYE